MSDEEISAQLVLPQPPHTSNDSDGLARKAVKTKKYTGKEVANHPLATHSRNALISDDGAGKKNTESNTDSGSSINSYNQADHREDSGTAHGVDNGEINNNFFTEEPATETSTDVSIIDAAPIETGSLNDPDLRDAAGLLAPGGGEKSKRKPLFLAAIGASAGGLHSLEEFFKYMPAKTGIAFVVIQHLSPDFKSLMQELLARHTKMDVKRVINGMTIEADTVYLIPPKKNMTMLNGHLELTDQEHRSGSNPSFPIDLFFRSLASAYGNRAIGVILSGTGSDGSRGVRTIDEEGGLVFVESAESAQFDGMPMAAIGTGTAREVMTPAEIASAIAEIANSKITSPSSVDPTGSTEIFKKIIALASDPKGVDFRQYKPSTISRRLDRRRLIAGSESLEDYFDLLTSSHAEIIALRTDLLVSVTAFFRDAPVWRKLRESVLPALIRATHENEIIRVWITACATGEEAYTMAMLLREVFESLGRTRQEAKIFATDIDSRALARAAHGLFPSSVVADVPKEFLTRYFTVTDGMYQINRQIREMIIFAPHNLIRDAPFTKTHIVSCRNALIYLQPAAQKHALRTLHFSLKRSGVLLLGASETVGDLSAEFKTLDKEWNIHMKLRDVRLSSPTTALPNMALTGKTLSALVPQSESNAQSKESLVSTALSTLVNTNAMVCLICDADFNMLHAVGDTKPFLEVPEGAMTNDITRLVSKVLSVPLNTAMNRSKREGKPVNYYGIDHSPSSSFSVDIQSTHKPATEGSTEVYIVVLKSSQPNPALKLTSIEVATDTDTLQRLKDQEIELQQAKQNLQSTIEELESTNSIQQRTNEQLTTANEELQSTNEELHSVNEELYTVNSEYQVKINELTELNNDIANLLESTDIGVVFLDDELNIRKYTPAATRAVRLRPNDIGRPFEDLSYHFEYPQLQTDIRRVLSLGEAIEREAAIDDSDYFLVRIHPYRAGTELTVGVVISFIDISELKHVEDALAQVEVRYRHLFQSELYGIAVSNLDEKTIIEANDTFFSLVGGDRNTLPLNYGNIYPESEIGFITDAVDELISSGTTPPTQTRLSKIDGSTIPVIISQTLVNQKDKTAVSFVIDATELNQKQKEIQHKNDEMEAVSVNLQQFAYIASQELLEPMRSISGYSTLLSDRYASKLDGAGSEYLKYILDSSARMDRVIDDLLLYSRVYTTGKEIEMFDSSRLLRHLVEEVKSTHDDLQITYEPGGVTYICADESQMNQLFMAIIDNATKFRSEKSVTLTITATEDNEHWFFHIKDNGIGLEQEDLQVIFNIFKRLHTRERFAGSGVGLAICKRIVERHSGSIWAESNGPDLGTTISFSIPKLEEAGKTPPPLQTRDRI